MRIQFQTEGGLGYFPGLNRPLSIDTTKLPPEQASELEQLVRNADIFSRPSEIGGPAPGAADYRTYTVSVDDHDQAHTIELTEPIDDPALRALIDHLTTEQRRTVAQQ